MQLGKTKTLSITDRVKTMNQHTWRGGRNGGGEKRGLTGLANHRQKVTKRRRTQEPNLKIAMRPFRGKATQERRETQETGMTVSEVPNRKRPKVNQRPKGSFHQVMNPAARKDIVDPKPMQLPGLGSEANQRGKRKNQRHNPSNFFKIQLLNFYIY